MDAIGNGYFSGEKLLSAPEKCPPSSASLTAQVPEEGRYKVWVHYEAPKDHNTRFGVAVEQRGQRVLNAEMGGADQVRLWPLNWGYKTQVNPAYGGGDNVTWQGAEVDLAAGEATFFLNTLDNPAPAAKRNIDVIYVTSDLSDKPKKPTDPFLDDLLRPGRLWVRVRNTGDKPFRVSSGVKINRRNWRIEPWLYERSGLPALHRRRYRPVGCRSGPTWVP